MSSGGGQGCNQVPPPLATIPAGMDHPLASGSLLTPTNSAPSSSDHPLVATPIVSPPPIAAASAAASTVVVSNTATPTRKNLVSAPVSAPPPTSSFQLSQFTSNQTLDALADEFLSQPSRRTEKLGLEPLFKPNPLPAHDTELDRLRTLVERRAWGDVLKVTTNLLTTNTATTSSSSSSMYSDVYTSLLISPDAVVVDHVPDITNVPIQVRTETVEIMMLQCHAWLKLRRYKELVTEVERWNFWIQNDATAQSPEWLPWSMYVK
jgi:hypothetical protein